jgi:hypothetical protein
MTKWVYIEVRGGFATVRGKSSGVGVVIDDYDRPDGNPARDEYDPEGAIVAGREKSPVAVP